MRATAWLNARKMLVVCAGVMLLAGPVSGCRPPSEQPPLETQGNKGQLFLRAVGSARVEADKNANITLNLVATFLEVGPAANIDVVVDFAGAAKGELRTGVYKTNDQGFVEIPYHTPDEDNVTVMIRCRAEGAPTINFTVDIARDTVKIDFVGRKPLLMRKGAESEFIVGATNQRGAPVSGVEISVELIGSSDSGAGIIGFTTTWTDGSGQARFLFNPGGSLTTFQLKATSPRLNEARVEVIVADRIPQNELCSFTSDCEPGKVCTEGQCVEGNRRCRTNHPEDCPEGYACEMNICVYRGCQGQEDCLPDADLDITGRWRTEYVFDLTPFLGALQNFGDELGTVDALFQGKLPVDIPIFGPIIELMLQELIKAYVPDWLPKLLTAFNDLFSALTDTHIFGVMELKPKQAGSNELLGEEAWNVVNVKIPSLCARRQNDPNWPACATVNIQVAPNLGSGISAKATAKPFEGRVAGVVLELYGREVEVEMQKLIANLIDLTINVASNGRVKNVEELVVAVVNCPALTEAAGDIACDVTNGGTCSLGWFEPVCNSVAQVLGLIIGAKIDEIPLLWTLSEFIQGAVAEDTVAPNTKADILKDGTLSGRTNLIIGRPMTGTFKAYR